MELMGNKINFDNLTNKFIYRPILSSLFTSSTSFFGSLGEAQVLIGFVAAHSSD